MIWLSILLLCRTCQMLLGNLRSVPEINIPVFTSFLLCQWWKLSLIAIIFFRFILGDLRRKASHSLLLYHSSHQHPCCFSIDLHQTRREGSFLHKLSLTILTILPYHSQAAYKTISSVPGILLLWWFLSLWRLLSVYPGGSKQWRMRARRKKVTSSLSRRAGQQQQFQNELQRPLICSR